MIYPSLREVLRRRGFIGEAAVERLLAPALRDLGSPEDFPQMPFAVQRLRQAIRDEEPVGLYADRDVDGLTGLAILVRSLRTLGGQVHWGCPPGGRGLNRAVLEQLAARGVRVLILVDCGTGETKEIAWLAGQGIDVIVADHHRLSETRPEALAWIHPGMSNGASGESPAGCVMAFKLAQGLWTSFLGDDAERLDYFLFDHLDLLALGILADRVPLTGENRVLVWHGLRRLAATRKGGLASLLRFFRLTPRPGPITVREATWRIIPMLNAAGRLGQPACAVELLLTEDAWTARQRIDELLQLNQQRRSAQVRSVERFEQVVLEQCDLEADAVLVALAEGLEPSVTGLAAQHLVQRYDRPAFLFVQQGQEAVGSARGTGDVDLFEWVEAQRDLLVKYGGHEGAAGLTVRMEDFPVLRERILARGRAQASPARDIAPVPEAALTLEEADAGWWNALQRLEPFGPGFPVPVFELQGIDAIVPAGRAVAARAVRKPALSKRAPAAVRLRSGSGEQPAEVADGAPIVPGLESGGPWTVIAWPAPGRPEEAPFKWMIQEVRRSHV